MTPENHDAAFAAVSHLPHLLAFAYFSAVANQPAGRDFLSLAGPGFRDFTRIAASDPTVWRDILMANREEVLKQSHALPPHARRAGARHARGQRRGAGRPDPQRRPRAARSWQMGARASPAAAALTASRAAPPPTCRRMYDIPFLDLPPLRGAAGTRAPAGLEEHLQPRAAAGRPGAGHDASCTTCSTPTTRA